MNAHLRCRCRTGSAALFCGLADQLADVIPIVGRNALSNGPGRELRVLQPNGIGLCLPLGVAFARCHRLLVVVLLRPLRRADQLLADQFDDLDRDRNIGGALIFLRQPAKGPACVTFGALRNWATVGPKGRISGQPICSGMPRCATSSHLTDLFAMGPFGLYVIVHLNTCKPADSTMPKRGAPARMASAI